MPNWSWQEDARCRGEKLVLFFGPEGERQPERDVREPKAKAICRGCPALLACRETAFQLNHHNGVWGGLGEEERAIKRRTWLKATARARAEVS
ncbi:WhiB family transcriptional regulator [Nonomuraea sp. NPDC059023]|uniref:WhiB family transcriptional regulator n=1 Tax=unclassified Nonomuraea TaxID=2593643 RepID=UPI00368080AE